MSEYADKHSKAGRKDRVEHVLRVDPKARIDASGYTPPDALDADVKTGERPKPRKYAKGGVVEGHKAHHHAGRKSRDAGGQAAVQQLRPNVPTSGLYGSGFQPTHAGMMSTAAGLKKGGKACHKAKGGEVPGNNEITGTRQTGGRLAKARGGEAKIPHVPAKWEHWKDERPQVRQLPRTEPADSDGGKWSGWKDERPKTVVDGRIKRADGGKAQRQNGESRAEYRIDEQERAARKDGGRAKGKTNINIIIGAPKEEPKGPMVPPPPSAIPPGAPLPKPGLPPAAMGAMQPPGMGGLGSGPMPPQMPAGMGPR